MNRSIALMLLMGTVILFCPSHARASLATMQVNLIDGQADTTFDGQILRIHQTSFAGGAPLILSGSGGFKFDFTDISIDLVATYQGMGTFSDGTPYGRFSNGSLAITFADAAGSYEVSGPLDLLRIAVGPTQSVPVPESRLDGYGLFLATTTDMPVDFEWVLLDPPIGPYSVIDALAIVVQEDLTGFDWSAPAALSGDAEAMFALFPDGVPEPTFGGLLLFGGILLLRRR